METRKHTIIPRYIVVLRPTRSEIFPEKGLDIPADIVKRVMTSPLMSAPPKDVMKPFSSGMIKLKLIMKKNMESDMIQKFDPYLKIDFIEWQKYEHSFGWMNYCPCFSISSLYELCDNGCRNDWW